jgi:glycosyltransferase involved in cell wall biosynthesis
MEVSIVTITYNDAETIQDTIDSVRSQEYVDIEYVIKDGKSTDGTVEIIKRNEDVIDRWQSTEDEGLFDALNAGIRMTTGDIVGMLHADDLFYRTDILNSVVVTMESEGADVCWGDLVYVDREDPSKVVRYWESSEFQPGKFARGWMPPHLTFFAKRDLFDRYGYYDTDLRMSADYELMLRFLKAHNVPGAYVPRVMVKMRTGGVSDRSIGNIPQILRNQWDCYRAWKTNDLAGGWLVPIVKPLLKLPQSFRTPPQSKT